ncbi:MAG TPA: hypothetical protein VGI00_02055 [Streptosporangiaceae bacterium]|jgi:hypothetical protein
MARIATASVFGPYVVGSIRTEQLFVLSMLIAIVTVGWPVTIRHSFHPFPVVLTWVGLCVVVMLGTIWRPPDLGSYGQQPASHGFAVFVMPLAFLMVTWFWTLTADTVDLIRDIARIIVAVMAANSMIAMVQLTTGNPGFSSLLPHFWSGAASAAVAQVAGAQNGRFTGIFNQPADAGVAYGLAVFCLIYLVRQAVQPRWKLASVTAALLVTGGALSLSKVFILGAVPIAVVLVARRQRARSRAIAGTAFAGATLWCLAAVGALPSWPAATATVKGIVSGSSLTTSVSGGRYGTGGTLGPVVSDVLRSAPWTGFGAGGLNVPYDSLWVQVLAVAGLLGVLLMLAVMALLMVRWLRQRGVLGPAQRSLAGASLALLAGASLGLPSLTSDPAAALGWLIIGVLITAQPVRRHAAGPAHTAVPPIWVPPQGPRPLYPVS